MIRNNKYVLFDKDFVAELVPRILNLANEKTINFEMKAKMLGVLRLLCTYNNKAYPDNQSIILSILQSKKYE